MLARGPHQALTSLIRHFISTNSWTCHPLDNHSPVAVSEDPLENA